MVRIYIRHSDKAYRNGHNDTLKHDPPITDDGKVKALQTAQALIQKFGPPVLIMSSPYRRTRETALAMREALITSDNLYIPEIRYDKYISEYLGNHSETDITEETAVHLPPSHNEDLTGFKNRIRQHIQIASLIDELPYPVWFITHCFVISTITEILGPHYIRKFSPLGCIQIEKTGCILKALPINLDPNVIPVETKDKKLVRKTRGAHKGKLLLKN
jgi:phosphohistidine phosphatase SixA